VSAAKMAIGTTAKPTKAYAQIWIILNQSARTSIGAHRMAIGTAYIPMIV
jgi:hypothetical protein